MLETAHLSKQFNSKPALEAITLKVNPGEIYCLLGANGAGKTTLINLFLNFLEPTSGSARINDLDVVQHPLETKKYVTYIPKQVMLYGTLSGLENLDYFAALATGQRLSRAHLPELLAEVGLDSSVADKRVATYSKGMRQKVGIAIAVARQAKALLLDEPTSGLDPSAANEFSQLLKKARDDGVAVLTTTHDLFYAKQTGTRIGIMKQGRLVANLNSDDISHTDLEQLHLSICGINVACAVRTMDIRWHQRQSAVFRSGNARVSRGNGTGSDAVILKEKCFCFSISGLTFKTADPTPMRG